MPRYKLVGRGGWRSEHMPGRTLTFLEAQRLYQHANAEMAKDFGVEPQSFYRVVEA